MTQREAVYRAHDGRCVACGHRWSRNSRGWDCHHALKAQWLRQRRAPSRYLRTEIVCVLACRACHFNHESRVRVIPLEALPERVVRAVDALGPWAEDLLRRYHPPTGAAAVPRHDEGSPHGR
jgi:hypothetical protein